MVVHFFKEHFVGDAIKQVFTRMDLIANVNPAGIKLVQNRHPAFGKFRKTGIYQSFRALRPGVEHVPQQRAAKGGMGI
ncbi:hypothetical protein D3C86_1786370 [compost metagenome]